ncbi:MAG: leucine-rich repeat domain-containing protein [Clostridia bacterium]|nr:leucine-rich repeat domain-containing protein [Clostridia bacterium]
MWTEIKSKINKIYVVVFALIVLICPLVFTGCAEVKITEVIAEDYNTEFFVGEDFSTGDDFEVFVEYDDNGDLVRLLSHSYDVDSSDYDKTRVGTYDIVVSVNKTKKTYTYQVTVKSPVLLKNENNLSFTIPFTSGYNQEVFVSDCETYVVSVVVPAYVKKMNNVWYSGNDVTTSFGYNDTVYKVTRIDYDTFKDCSNLTSVTIPSTVTDIRSGAFDGCSSLSTIEVDNNNTVYDSRNNCNAIIETETNSLYVGCKNTTIPSTVTSISAGAFYNCSGLTSITIPNSVTSIENAAFLGCSSLTSVYIDSETIAIGINAKNSFEYLVNYATTIYINEEIVDGGASIGSYITSNFTRSTSAISGYYVYTKN